LSGTKRKTSTSANSALEQAASAARPWQRAQGKAVTRGGPRPVPSPPLLTAGVRPMKVAKLAILAALLLVGTVTCGNDGIPMNSPELFRSDVISIRITYSVRDKQNALTYSTVVLTDSSATQAIVAELRKVVLRPVRQPDTFSFGHVPTSMVQFATARGVVKAGYTAEWIRVISGPRTGEGTMLRTLYDKLQGYASQAVVDSMAGRLGPHSTVVTK
jgi:hypothetical protein